MSKIKQKSPIKQPSKGKGKYRYWVIAQSKRTGKQNVYEFFSNYIAGSLGFLLFPQQFEKANKYLKYIDVRQATEGQTRKDFIRLWNAIHHGF